MAAAWHRSGGPSASPTPTCSAPSSAATSTPSWPRATTSSTSSSSGAAGSPSTALIPALVNVHHLVWIDLGEPKPKTWREALEHRLQFAAERTLVRRLKHFRACSPRLVGPMKGVNPCGRHHRRPRRHRRLALRLHPRRPPLPDADDQPGRQHGLVSRLLGGRPAPDEALARDQAAGPRGEAPDHRLVGPLGPGGVPGDARRRGSSRTSPTSAPTSRGRPSWSTPRAGAAG